MVNRAIAIASFLATAVLLVMLNLTTPTEIGPFGVLLFFMLIYVVMLGVATGVVWVVRKALGKKGDLGRRDRMCAVLVAFAPILLLLAQSMGSMGLLTLVLVAIFVALGSFFIYKKA